MGRTKSSSGVQAVVERLTGQKPCPAYLRNAANKYLDSSLFPNSRRSEADRAEKLANKEAELILINALTLDEAFRGETEKVAKIIQNELDPTELSRAIDDAQREINRRFEIYAYWREHFGTLNSADNFMDRASRKTMDQRLVVGLADAQRGRFILVCRTARHPAIRACLTYLVQTRQKIIDVVHLLPFSSSKKPRRGHSDEAKE